MKVSIFAPDFDALVQPDGSLLFASDGNPVYRANVLPALGTVHPATEYIPIKPALDFETRFLRLEGPPSPLMSGDRSDTTKNTHTTGGGRRSYVSVAMNRSLRGLADGPVALRQWAADQANRPTWHGAALMESGWTYNGYHGALTTGWKYDTTDSRGWNICDPAHLEHAPLFGGAAIGDRLALAQFALLLIWVTRTNINGATGKLQSWWRGGDQERAVGWTPWLLARAALLGIGIGDECKEFRDRFLGGIDPKTHLIECARSVVAQPPPWGSGTVDDRTMVRISPTEIKATYGWQNGIMLAGWGYAMRTGVIANGRLSKLLATWLVDRADALVNRAVGPGGVSYAFSREDDFTQPDVDLANQNETDKTHVYELVDGGGGLGVIRDRPRLADTELTCAGLAFGRGHLDPDVVRLLALLPPPTNTQKYDDIARYLDPVHALAETRT